MTVDCMGIAIDHLVGWKGKHVRKQQHYDEILLEVMK